MIRRRERDSVAVETSGASPNSQDRGDRVPPFGFDRQFPSHAD
jgi:hypothetical protein